jgi:hypothetical protein
MKIKTLQNFIYKHTTILYINCLVCASVCRGPEMSRTWPEMFQRQVRVVVAERHTQAWEGGFVFPRAQRCKQVSLGLQIERREKGNLVTSDGSYRLLLEI